MSQYHDLNTILTALRTRMIQKKSGTFFIATDDNASARFALNDGQLTHCSFKRQNGEEAVQAFCDVTSGRYSFSDAPFPFRNNSRIEHDNALQILGIMLPKGPVFTPVKKPARDSHPLSTHEPDKTTATEKHVTYRMYRGQRIAVEQPPPRHAASEQKKAVRYYRGQRIEE